MDTPRIECPPPLGEQFRDLMFTVPYIHLLMDWKFSLTEFEKGTRQAVCFISNKLSNAEFDDLEDVIVPEALAEIKKNMAGFSMAQRKMLAVKPERIQHSFPCAFRIIPVNQPEPGFVEGDRKPPEVSRHVEITYVLDALAGERPKYQQCRNWAEKTLLFLEDYHRNLMECNYRFRRDFTPGTEPKWVVTLTNHFAGLDVYKTGT